MTPDQLPGVAQAKLAAIAEAADTAAVLLRGATAAIAAAQAQMPKARNALDADPGNERAASAIEALEVEIERLRGVARRRMERVQNDGQVASALRDFVANLKPSVLLEVAPPVEGRGSIEGVRQQIFDLQQQLLTLRAAPLPTIELRAKVREFVSALAARGCPSIRTERGAFEVEWRRYASGTPAATPEDVVATLAWLNPEALIAALERELPEGEGVGAAERAEAEADLTARILHLERIEEALIEARPEVPRRPDANPLAVLGLRFSESVEARAA